MRIGKYVIAGALAALLTVLFLEHKQTAEIDEVRSRAASDPGFAVAKQPLGTSQPASIEAPSVVQSIGSDAAATPPPSPDPQTASRTDSLSPQPVCTAKADANSRKPLSPGEVSALVQGYGLRCPDKLFSSLDEIFQEEERDESWAAKLEEKIGKATGADGAHLKGVCHTSLCRLDPDTSQPGACNRADVNHSLVMSVTGTELEGEIIYRFTPCSRFFYALDGPPAFVEPLRERLGDP
jgi:hypothetical protein